MVNNDEIIVERQFIFQNETEESTTILSCFTMVCL